MKKIVWKYYASVYDKDMQTHFWKKTTNYVNCLPKNMEKAWILFYWCVNEIGKAQSKT